jgi:LPPG:FO 2-phospho-L-lactate transferase
VTVVCLAGGTGGAKLARGLLDVAGHELVVIANTADDVELYGAYVSPDPDLVTFWLADRIDERGWGLDGDTFAAMEQLRELGREVWFNLGDRDLAIGLHRAERLAAGARLTDTLHELGLAFGHGARVLPMTDAPVRTHVRADGRWWPFQEFMIRRRGEGPVEDVRLHGIEDARPSPEVLEALRRARAIVVGPSNPVISIGPILAVPGIREAIAAGAAPVVAVSPIVEGEVLKGPTAAFLDWSGRSLDATGIATTYGELLDGLVCDERADLPVPSLVTDTRMGDAQARRRVARETLDFARALSR